MKNEKNIPNLTINEEKLTQALNDLANGLEDSVRILRHQICELINIDKDSTWDPDKITWEQAEGAAGPYPRSNDVNNLDFKVMHENLAANQGKLARDGYFYWIFKNATTVGRKKTERRCKQQ